MYEKWIRFKKRITPSTLQRNNKRFVSDLKRYLIDDPTEKNKQPLMQESYSIVRDFNLACNIYPNGGSVS